MERKHVPYSENELRIGILDDDPCALAHETELVRRVQNLNGCHPTIWTTTNPEYAVHNCLFGPAPTHVFIVDLETERRFGGRILRPIKVAVPKMTIIGITSHLEEHPPSQYGSELDAIFSKTVLGKTLPTTITALHQQRTRKNRHLSSVQKREPKRSSRENMDWEPRTGKFATEMITHTNSEQHNSYQDAQMTHIALNHTEQQAYSQHLSKPEESIGLSTMKMNPRLIAQMPNHLATVPLTRTEQQVLALSLNMTPQQIAEHLTVTTSTIYSHRHAIRRKMHADSWDNAIETYLELCNGTM
jgi:DNA-binding NarL/FixJ family response regulator